MNSTDKEISYNMFNKLPIELLINFKVPSGINNEFENIFTEIKNTNIKKIELLIKELNILNLYKIIINNDIRFWNLSKMNFESLILSNNSIISLPDIFCNIKVRCTLDLSNNLITNLPLNFGNIEVGSLLTLYGNKLIELPSTFGDIKIEQDLDLSFNQLKLLPKNF